jgi:hypothetical protein
MSLIGKKSAVVSLGSACQAAFQIRLHADLLSQALGDELVPSRLPFDWTIAPPARAADWIAASDRFPRSPDALSPVPGEKGAFYWRERGVYFWHDFKTQDGIDVAGTFEYTRDKYERHFEKLRNLGELETVIAVVANTQNNLDGILPDKADLLYRRADVVRLKTAFETEIGRPCRMLCVTYGDRRTPGFWNTPKLDIMVKWIPHAPSPWQGSRRHWGTTFRNYFA